MRPDPVQILPQAVQLLPDAVQLRAIDYVLASPLLRGAECHLLRAGSVDDKARYDLEEAAEKLRAAGFAVKPHVVAGEPEAAAATGRMSAGPVRKFGTGCPASRKNSATWIGPALSQLFNFVFTKNLSKEWLSNIRGDLLAGIVVALALIPEAIAFSIIAGVDPKVGLYGSFCIAVTIAIFGGRPGMISAATAATALLMGTLVRQHGVEYLFAATLLTGVLQVIAGALRVGAVMRFVSRSVMTGFVNALAILIFLAQMPEFKGAGWLVYAMVAAALAIIYLFPRLTKAVPSPLVTIIVLTIVSVSMQLPVRTVGDLGQLPSTLPIFAWPSVPFTLETFLIILPYAVGIAAVGLLESLMTAQIVDEMTDTPSDKNRECVGQGLANFVSGLFGGMAGCAMIGQSVINVKSGGRGRLSTFAAGIFLMILLVALNQWATQIPMPALVGIMIMVSIGTFSWASFKNLRVHPKSTSLVMIATVVVVVWTHNLALGVGVGVLLSALSFARKVAQVIRVKSELDASGETRTYTVQGQVFFASAPSFLAGFDFKEAVPRIVIDVSHAHFWDLTAVGALDKVVLKFRREGAEVEVRGMNEASATIVDRLAIHDKPGALDRLLEH